MQSPAAKATPAAAPPGRIDNSALMPSVLRQLNNGLEEGIDFVAVSEKSWEQLHNWCGCLHAHQIPYRLLIAADCKSSCENDATAFPG